MKGMVLLPPSVRVLVLRMAAILASTWRGRRCRGLRREAEEDGAVGAVADAGEGERTVEIDGDLCGFFEEICGGEFAGEAEGGAHGTDGVRAGGADADFEEFEEAGVHGGLL